MPDAKTGPTDAYSMILEAIDIGTYRPGDRLVERSEEHTSELQSH